MTDDVLPWSDVVSGVGDEPATRLGLEIDVQAAVRFAYLLAGDQHRAEDAVAEALARVWPQWRKGTVADVGPYLRRAIVNELRARGRRRRLEVRVAERRRAEAGSQAVEDQFADRSVLVAALAQLPLRQRAAVVLRYLEDRSEQEVAAALGTSVGTVKSQVSRGLVRLRGLLGEEAR